MFHTIQKLFGSDIPPQKKAGAGLKIMGPLPTLSHGYALERTIRELGLTGWMRHLETYDLEIEVYGSFQAISELIKQLEHGSVMQKRLQYQVIWLPYQSNYSRFDYHACSPTYP